MSARQARTLIATAKPRDVLGKTRRRLAVELIGELEAIDKRSPWRRASATRWLAVEVTASILSPLPPQERSSSR
jgi:hypothetical protein